QAFQELGGSMVIEFHNYSLGCWLTQNVPGTAKHISLKSLNIDLNERWDRRACHVEHGDWDCIRSIIRGNVVHGVKSRCKQHGARLGSNRFAAHLDAVSHAIEFDVAHQPSEC